VSQQKNDNGGGVGVCVDGCCVFDQRQKKWIHSNEMGPLSPCKHKNKTKQLNENTPKRKLRGLTPKPRVSCNTNTPPRPNVVFFFKQKKKQWVKQKTPTRRRRWEKPTLHLNKKPKKKGHPLDEGKSKKKRKLDPSG